MENALPVQRKENLLQDFFFKASFGSCTNKKYIKKCFVEIYASKHFPREYRSSFLHNLRIAQPYVEAVQLLI